MNLGQNIERKGPKGFCCFLHRHCRDDKCDSFVDLPPVILNQFGSSSFEEGVKSGKEVYKVLGKNWKLG